MKIDMTRRRSLYGALAGVAAIGAGGTLWRAWSNGVFSVGEGPAYAPWRAWPHAAAEGPPGLVEAGILASNAHNTQPWRFRVSQDTIALHADPARHLGNFDPFRREMQLSLGCVLENIWLAARARGLEVRVETRGGRLAPGDTEAAPVAVIRLTPGERAEIPEYRAIANRRTHRGAYDARAVPAALQEEMQGLAARAPNSGSLRLVLFGAGPEKDRLGELIVTATQAIIGDREMAMDSARWFRFDWRAIQEHRDGVTIDTVGLPPLLTAAAKIIPAPSPEQADRQWLAGTRDVHVATAPLMGLIAVRDLYDRPTALDAGRLWQRLHLWATHRGLAAQPLNQPCEMVDREAVLGAPPRTAAALASLTGDEAWRPTFIFRMGYAVEAARLSPRRSPNQVLAG